MEVEELMIINDNNNNHQQQQQHSIITELLPTHLTNGSSIKSIPIPIPLEDEVPVVEVEVEEKEVVDSKDYEKELPIIMNDLIPLNFIIERLIGQAYAELVNLTETLPSTPDIEKKRVIVDYVLQTRRQILKLLVLVRWSNEASNVGRCMNIVGFLSRQNYEFDHAIESLTEVKSMLAGARLRNYDIPTALSVLTTGTYTALPSIITTTFGTEEKLSNSIVNSTILELEEILRWRLNCIEFLPRIMKNYSNWIIGNGRAIFKIDGMWEGEFTFGGDNDDDDANWYLLNLKFLFRVKDTRVWSSSPIGPMKDHIIELCNSELARRLPPPPPVPIEGIDTLPIVEDSETSFKDAPLIRGYNFIQRLALCYQLESLNTQALLLSATIWSGNLRVEFSTDRKTLRLEYWAPPPIPQIKPRTTATTSSSSVPPIQSSPQGILIISMDELDSISLSSSNKNKNNKEKEKDKEIEEVQQNLKIVWIAENLSEEKKLEVDLNLDADLDLEALLLKTTSLHAREATLQLYDLLLLDLQSSDLLLLSSPTSSTSATSTKPSQISGIQIHLHGQHYVIASINNFSGRLEFKAVGEVSISRESRLRNAADKVDRDRKLTGEILLRVRASTILDEVDSRAAYLGLTTLRRLPLRPQDITKLNNLTRQFSFIKLHHLQLPFHYLVLIMTELEFKFALISVKEDSDGNLQTWLSIEEIGWLDRGSIAGEGKKKEFYAFDLSIEDLRDLHSYCVQRIAFFKIEQQLHIRRIPYKPVAATSTSSSTTTSDDSISSNNKGKNKRPPSLSETSPYLVIQSSDLIRSNVKVAYSNIAIQCYLQDNIIKTTIYVRFRDLSLVDFPNPSDLPSSMTCDPKTWTITFTSDNLDECIPTFLNAYSVITRAILLARHNRSVARQQEVAKSKMITG